MAASLAEYVRENPPGKFNPKAAYFEVGDFVTYFSKADTYRADRVDQILTLYRSELTNEVIGFKVKSVRKIVELLARFGIDGMSLSYASEELKLTVVLMSASILAGDDKRNCYEEVSRTVAKDATIPTSKLPRPVLAA